MKKVEESLEEKYLPNKKVILMPTPRKGGFISKPTHIMYFMMDGATISWVLPRKAEAPGQLVNPFESAEEQKFFEEKLGVDLNPYKKSDNFWRGDAAFAVTLVKDAALLHTGKTFNLNDPYDALKVKILKLHPDEIAPSWDKKMSKPSQKWALKDETQEIFDKADVAEDKTKAYVHFSKLQSSEAEMIKFLKVYGASNKMDNTVPPNAKKAFLIKEIENIITTNIKGYLRIIDSDNWDIKSFLEDAITCGSVLKKGVKYYLDGGDPINETDLSYEGTIRELIKWEEDQDKRYLIIKARIENTK